jgi:uncharacterized membrane protein YfcA
MAAPQHPQSTVARAAPALPTAGLATGAILAGTILAGLVYWECLSRLGFTSAAQATVAAVGIAALLSGIAGFAFSPICGAMLFQFRSDPVQVIQIMLVCSIANQTMSVWMLRREISARALVPFLLGGLVGVPSGVWLLLHLDAQVYEKGLGAVLLAYGGYMLFRPPIVLRAAPRAGDVLSGFLGGLAGGFAATPGAPVSIWCGMKGWDKLRQRAVFQPFILLMQLVALASIARMHPHGMAHPGIPAIAWACVPAGLIGTWWALGCFRRLSDWQFATAINLLLIVSGLGLAL